MVALGNKKFGAVVFDDPKAPEEGWISLQGKQASRIRSMADLSTDTIWWTNIKYEDFYLNTDSWKNPWLRHDKYLVVDPRRALMEWGYDPDKADGQFQAMFASNIFHRTMSLAFRLAAPNLGREASHEDFFVHKTMREDFRALVPDLDYPKGEAADIMQSGKAFQEFTTTLVRKPKDAVWLTFQRPRVSYAIEMFKTPVPKAPFEPLTRGDLPSDPVERVKWVLHAHQPVMAELNIQELDPGFGPIFGFGYNANKQKRVTRHWVAHPEFLLMSRFAKMDVRSVYLGEQYDTLPRLLPDNIRAFLSDKFSEFSWSAGIVAEALWRAATLPEEKRRDDRRSKPGTSWQGAWIRAADRCSLSLSAMNLADRGYAVASYGLGWVKVAVPEEEVRDCIRDAMSLGYVPFMSHVEDGVFDSASDVPWGGDDRTRQYAALVATGKRRWLWRIDMLPLMDKEKRAQFLKQMKQSNGKAA